jgi:hypothetical protein
LALSCQEERGRAGPLCPGSSDVNLLGYGKTVIDLDAKIPHRTFDFFYAQYYSQIAKWVNEGCLGSA